MRSDSEWADLTWENERVAGPAELSGLHQAVALSTAPAAARSGAAHPAGGPLDCAGGPAAHRSWAVRSLTARTRRWRSRG